MFYTFVYFKFVSNVLSEEMCPQSAPDDVQAFCCPDVNGELVPPVRIQDSHLIYCLP